MKHFLDGLMVNCEENRSFALYTKDLFFRALCICFSVDTSSSLSFEGSYLLLTYVNWVCDLYLDFDSSSRCSSFRLFGLLILHFQICFSVSQSTPCSWSSLFRFCFLLQLAHRILTALSEDLWFSLRAISDCFAFCCRSLLPAKSSSDYFAPTASETSTSTVINYDSDLLAYFANDSSSELCFYFLDRIRKAQNLIGSLLLISNFAVHLKSFLFQLSEWAHLCQGL